MLAWAFASAAGGAELKSGRLSEALGRNALRLVEELGGSQLMGTGRILDDFGSFWVSFLEILGDFGGGMFGTSQLRM